MGEIAVSFNVQLWLWTERVVNLIIRRRESQSITTRINWLRVEHPARATNKGNWHPWLLLANCVAISSLYCFNLLVKLEQWTVRFSRGHCAWLTVITYILQWNGKRFYCFKCVLIMFHGAFYLFHLIRRINSIFIAKIRGRYCCGVLWQKKICRSYDLVIRSLFFLSPQQRNILWDFVRERSSYYAVGYPIGRYGWWLLNRTLSPKN